jgi:hypothetical protein
MHNDTIKVTGMPKTENHGAFVSIGADPSLQGSDFVSVSFFVSPDSARTLAIDLLKAADKADGGQGWQERLSDALAAKFETTTTSNPTE